jgi:hypothetical protein
MRRPSVTALTLSRILSGLARAGTTGDNAHPGSATCTRPWQIATRQVITCTTWNASSRDSHAAPGHVEQSLAGLRPAKPAPASRTRPGQPPPLPRPHHPGEVIAPHIRSRRPPASRPHRRRCRRTGRRHPNPPEGSAANITGEDPDSCPHPDTASRPTETGDTGPPRQGHRMILPRNSDGDDGRERSRPYRRLRARLSRAFRVADRLADPVTGPCRSRRPGRIFMHRRVWGKRPLLPR